MNVVQRLAIQEYDAKWCGTILQCPETIGAEEVKEKLKRLPGGPTQPLTVHLRQEIDRLNIIIRLSRETLTNLRLAIAGARAACHIALIGLGLQFELLHLEQLSFNCIYLEVLLQFAPLNPETIYIDTLDLWASIVGIMASR